MASDVPGLRKNPQRTVLYIACASKADFKKFMRQQNPEGVALPSDGGVLSENVVVTIPAGSKYFGLSFGGDLDGWERYVLAMAKEKGVGVARINDREELEHDGKFDKISACEVEFY